MADIKYSWTGRPKNVSRQTYERFSFVQFGTVATGGLAAICFISAFMSLIGLGLGNDPFKNLESLSVSEALEYQGDRAAFKLSGRLIADPPVVMPDDANLNVLVGEVRLTVQDRDNELEPVTLLDWEAQADPIFLEQGSDRIPFQLDLSILPREEDRFADRDLIYQGDNARTRTLAAVDYNNQRYPLPPAYLQLSETPSVKVTRQYFIQGQSVVVVAGIENQGDGPKLVPPLGQKAQLWVGTEDEIATRRITTIPLLMLVGTVGAVSCFFLSQKYLQMRQEIVAKSNVLF